MVCSISEIEVNFFKKKSPYSYRKAISSDAGRIAELIANEYGHSKQMYVQRTLEDLKYSSARMVCVAEREGKIIGYGRAKLFKGNHYPHPGPMGWYLMGLIVQPNERRNGVGNALIDFRLNLISKISPSVFYCTNTMNTSSIELHKKFGFKEIDRGEGFLSVNFDREFSDTGILYRLDF